jgi:DNA modification methylase
MLGTPLEVLAGTARFAVVCGDATEVLKSLPNNTAHVCYCDPPYGLSAHGTDDVLRCLTAWLSGDVYTHGGRGFLGKEWDAFVPGPELWREAYRVLKPGAYCVAFSSTRTVDLLGISMRIAGGEMRDGWAWLQGQGFPKNHDVSKAIDKVNGESGRCKKFVAWMRTTGLNPSQIDTALREAGRISATSRFAVHFFNEGQPAIPTREMWEVVRPMCGDVPPWVDELVERIEAERAVVGTQKSSLGGTVAAGERDESYIGKHKDLEYEVTAPATDAAKQWEGYGTTPKPAYEPLVVTRRPMDGTVANNVLTHGCGALNIDGARITTGENLNGTARHDGDENWRLKRDGGAGEYTQPSGRFPANLAVVHDEGCELKGTHKVKGSNAMLAKTPKHVRDSYLGGMGAHPATNGSGEFGYADKDGNETVEKWDCTDTCAARALSEQSGDRSSPWVGNSKGHAVGRRGGQMFGGGNQNITTKHDYGDTGDATRFFYQGKARASDRLQYMTCSEGCTLHNTVAPYSAFPGKVCPACKSPQERYLHPTVKPYDLAAYHAKLLSLPKHVAPVAIVPFCGTGVEARALLDAGFRVIAVDIDPRHCAMTTFRLSGAQPSGSVSSTPSREVSIDDLLGLT